MQYPALVTSASRGACSLCGAALESPNPECVRCWMRLQPPHIPLASEYEAGLVAEAARLARFAKLAQLGRPVHVGLVGCGKTKLPGRHKARDLYTSDYFRACLEYALDCCDEVYILSAKHGLLDLDQLVDSYDQRLTRCSEALYCWAKNTECSLRLKYVTPGGLLPVHVVMLAGADYAAPLHLTMRDWVVDWSEPMNSMTIMERRHFLKTWRENRCRASPSTPSLATSPPPTDRGARRAACAARATPSTATPSPSRRSSRATSRG